MIARLQREMTMLEQDPPHGVCAWPKDSKLNHLEASLQGPEGSPYEKGTFDLDIQIPDRYPLEPPTIRFITPVYHPNIDTNGRICLNILKMPPQGDWSPALNLTTVLTSIRLLLADPNEKDPLMFDIVGLVC
eukprot:TRINITY_DN1535_c0_g1_i3.p1 TRINITY_DN1535_c0_g1~~TRINITY_DN1535_c0_g1_i3.p1  ORF type:complete len:132 (-),score=19.82 TRINITY_DN1535_c0_g1_i3:422-817(-)